MFVPIPAALQAKPLLPARLSLISDGPPVCIPPSRDVNNGHAARSPAQNTRINSVARVGTPGAGPQKRGRWCGLRYLPEYCRNALILRRSLAQSDS